jgi:hypothetical protein
MEVSWYENSLKTRLLCLITQHLEDKLNSSGSFLKEIETKAYEDGVEHGSLKGFNHVGNCDWFVHAGLQQKETIEVFHKMIAFVVLGKCSP